MYGIKVTASTVNVTRECVICLAMGLRSNESTTTRRHFTPRRRNVTNRGFCTLSFSMVQRTPVSFNVARFWRGIIFSPGNISLNGIIKEITKIIPTQMHKGDDPIKIESCFFWSRTRSDFMVNSHVGGTKNLSAAWVYTSATALFLCKCLRLCRDFTICSLCMRPIDARSVDHAENRLW